MKKIVYLFLCLFAGSANAGLIGDTVHIAHNYSSLGSEVYTPMNVVVEEGSGDIAPVSPHYSVNVDDLSVYVDFGTSATWTVASFNGLVISGIDSILSNFVVTTNFAGWDDSRFTSTADSLRFNWNGLSFDSNTFFQLAFSDGDTHQVPEPAPIALLTLGLTGIWFSRKKRAA